MAGWQCLHHALIPVIIAAVFLTVTVSARGIPEKPFSIASVPSSANWARDLSRQGEVRGMAAALVEGYPYVAAFFQRGFGLFNARTGDLVMSDNSQKRTVFLDFVQNVILFVTEDRAVCIDPRSHEVLSLWHATEGTILHVVPTGGTCELVLFLSFQNGTTTVLVFHHSFQAEPIYSTNEPVTTGGLVMDDNKETVVVFGAPAHIVGVTYQRGEHFRVSVPSPVVLGPMLFANEFFVGDTDGIVRRYNASGGVTGRYQLTKTGVQVSSMDLAQDGTLLVVTVGTTAIGAFNLHTGEKIYEISAPPAEAVGGLHRVASSVYNNWEDNPELFENNTLWYFDDAGSFLELHTPSGVFVAIVRTFPKQLAPHVPGFATMVEGNYIAFQPYGMAYLCFIDIVTALPHLCYKQEGTNPLVTAVASWSRDSLPVFANDLGIVTLPKIESIPTVTFDPAHAGVGYENWTRRDGTNVHAMATSAKVVATLLDSTIRLYDLDTGAPLHAPFDAPNSSIVIYFGVIAENQLLAVSPDWVKFIALSPPYNVLFEWDTRTIHYAVPTGVAGEVVIYLRNNADFSTIYYYEKGLVTLIGNTQKRVNKDPIFLAGDQPGTGTLVHGEEHAVVGIACPSGVVLYRKDVTEDAWNGPFRINQYFYAANSSGYIHEYTASGQLLHVYDTDVRQHVWDIDVSLDGEIIVATAGGHTLVAFDVKTKTKLYQTVFVSPFGASIYRIYASTLDDWTSHVDAWHNDTMWFYDDLADFYPFNVRTGAFTAEIWAQNVKAQLPNAWAAGMSRIVVQIPHGPVSSYICSLAVDFSVIELCTHVDTSEILTATEWNARRDDILIAMSDGRIADVDQSTGTRAPTTKPPVTTSAPTTAATTATVTNHPHTTEVTTSTPPATGTTTATPDKEGDKVDKSALIIISLLAVFGIGAVVVLFRQRIAQCWAHSQHRTAERDENNLCVNEEELKYKRAAYQTV